MKELKDRCIKYRTLTEKALKKAKNIIPKNSALYDISIDFISMCQNYLHDGLYHEKKEDYSLALASYAYAHAW